MCDLKPVALTSYNVDKMSRHDLLTWVNTTVHGRYAKIEELCSGVAYCQIMEMMFPNCIGLKKIKLDAKNEYDYLHNLKLFQSAFMRLKFDKQVPLERLVKGRFQDNFEFLQWFKKFYDTNKGQVSVASSHDQTPAPTAVGYAQKQVQQKHRKSDSHINTENSNAKENKVVTESVQVLQETLDHLTSQTDVIRAERDHYYTKVVRLEAAFKNAIENNEQVEWCKRGLALLYASGVSAEGQKED